MTKLEKIARQIAAAVGVDLGDETKAEEFTEAVRVAVEASGEPETKETKGPEKTSEESLKELVASLTARMVSIEDSLRASQTKADASVAARLGDLVRSAALSKQQADAILVASKGGAEETAVEALIVAAKKNGPARQAMGSSMISGEQVGAGSMTEPHKIYASIMGRKPTGKKNEDTGEYIEVERAIEHFPDMFAGETEAAETIQ